jgi:uncharacterized FlaG/YvyC family protein
MRWQKAKSGIKMEFPITTPTTSSAQANQSQASNTVSQASVGNNALQSNPATTVNVAAKTGGSGGERQQDKLGAQLDQVINAQETVNDLQLSGRRTQINFNAELNRVFLQIVDTRTDEVVETIPTEELVRQMQEKAAPPEKLDKRPEIGTGPVDESI